MRAGARPVPGRAVRPGEDGLTRVVVGRGTLARLGTWIRDAGLDGPVFVLVSRHGRRLPRHRREGVARRGRHPQQVHRTR